MYNIQTWNLNPERLDFQLYRIRAQIVRDGLEGLEHVDALLRLRGCDPEAVHVPRKTKRTFKRGELRRAMLAALRDGPKRLGDIDVGADGGSLSCALWRARKAGLVVKEGGMWRLAP